MTPCMLTLPTIIADTQFLPCEVTVAVVRTAAIGFTVGNITGLALPVFVTFTVYLTGNGDTRCTFPMARAIVRTRVDSIKHNLYMSKFKKTEKGVWLIFCRLCNCTSSHIFNTISQCDVNFLFCPLLHLTQFRYTYLQLGLVHPMRLHGHHHVQLLRATQATSAGHVVPHTTLYKGFKMQMF